METLEAILTRRSIRQYQTTPVPEDLVQKLLTAAMSAPSARNSQPWRFVVIDDRKLLDQVPAINPYAEMARRAPLAILICADPVWKSPLATGCSTSRRQPRIMLLAAHGLELGAVWCGVYPRQPRIEGFRRLLGVPEEIVPHSLIVLGYTAESRPPEDRFQADRVYRNHW